MWVETALVFLFGLLWGSFGNVVIHRLPLGLSVVRPRSRCPECEKMIGWYDNIPVLSWVFLRGRCRSCKSPISARYPFVELLTGLMFAAIYARFGFTWLTLEYLIFAWGLIVVSFIDLDHMILPDVFTLSGVVIGLLGAALNPERSFLSALTGVLMGGGFLWLIAYLYLVFRKEEGMGGGDIKLLAWIGAVLGWTSVPFVILASSVVGSVVGLTLAARSKAGLKSVIPFGPYLAAAALLYMLGGDSLGLWYIGLFLPASTSVN
ncbi:MAG: prepilin peptidase [Bdellovibrionales bacterium]|nr:prepilin peptidase [Bdellovibrionales bacterium]